MQLCWGGRSLIRGLACRFLSGVGSGGDFGVCSFDLDDFAKLHIYLILELFATIANVMDWLQISLFLSSQSVFGIIL